MLKKTILDPNPSPAEEFHALGIPIGIFLIIHYPAIRHRFGILAPAMQMHTDGQTEDLSWEHFAV